MLRVEDAKIRDRFLVLIARVQPQFYRDTMLSEIRDGIAKYQPKIAQNLKWQAAVNQFDQQCEAENSLLLYHHYAYADIPIGTEYQFAGRLTASWKIEKETVLPCRCKVLSPILKYIMVPFYQIDHGHSSLCLIQFPDGVPSILDTLYEINSKTPINYQEMLFLTTQDTLQSV